MLRELHHIPLAQLKVSKLNVRRHGAKEIDSLAASIAALGIIQPLLVRSDGDGYEIVAGRRRYLAAKKLDADGAPDADKLPCVLLEADDDADRHRGLAGRERRAPADGRPGAVRGVRGAAQEGPGRGRHRRALRHLRADRQAPPGHRQPASRHPPPVPCRRDRHADPAAADAGHQGAAEGVAGAAQRSRAGAAAALAAQGVAAGRRGDRHHGGAVRRGACIRAASPPTCSARSGISPTRKSSGACRTPPSPSAASSCSNPAGPRCTSSSPTGASSPGTTRPWPRPTAAASTSWWSRTAMSPSTRDCKPTRRGAAGQAEAAGETRAREAQRRIERPEMSAPLANYVDLVRHSAVRLAVADAPEIALRLMLAHAIGGGRWWKVEAEPQRRRTASHRRGGRGACRARRVRQAARESGQAAAHRGGRRGDRRRHDASGARTAEVFARLLDMTGPKVLQGAGRGDGRDAGGGNGPDRHAGRSGSRSIVSQHWQPDDTFFALRARTARPSAPCSPR